MNEEILKVFKRALVVLLIMGTTMSICHVSKSSAIVALNEYDSNNYDDFNGTVTAQWFDKDGRLLATKTEYDIGGVDCMYEECKVVFTANVDTEEALTYKWRLWEVTSEDDGVDRTSYAQADGNQFVIEAKNLPKEWFELGFNESGKMFHVLIEAYKGESLVFDPDVSDYPYDFYLKKNGAEHSWNDVDFIDEKIEEKLFYVGDEITIPDETKIGVVYEDKDYVPGERIEGTIVDIKANGSGKVIKNEDGSFTLSVVSVKERANFNLIVEWELDRIPKDYYWVTATATPREGEIYTFDGVKYKIIKNDFDNYSFTAKIVGAKNSIKRANIGDDIDVGAHYYDVVGIASNAFKNKKKLTEVKISGGSLNSIGKNAFAGNKKLKKFVIDNYHFEKIGSKAFYGDSNLKKVVLKTTELKKLEVRHLPERQRSSPLRQSNMS